VDYHIDWNTLAMLTAIARVGILPNGKKAVLLMLLLLRVCNFRSAAEIC